MVRVISSENVPNVWAACVGWSCQREVFSQNVTNRQLIAIHAQSVNMSGNGISAADELAAKSKESNKKNN